jgi:hypothetical protein
MRTIRLPDLLIEVDNDLCFTDHFLPPAQRGGRDAEEVCSLLAVIRPSGNLSPGGEGDGLGRCPAGWVTRRRESRRPLPKGREGRGDGGRC